MKMKIKLRREVTDRCGKKCFLDTARKLHIQTHSIGYHMDESYIQQGGGYKVPPLTNDTLAIECD